jgi:hypothetical protein
MAPNVGHAMTYKILTADTRKIIVHDPAYVLLRSKKQRTYVSSRHGKSYSVRLISKNEATERALQRLLPTFSDGPSSPCQMMRETRETTVIGSSELQDGDLSGSAARDQLIRWKLKVGEDVYDEVMSYNRLIS